jgi:hypothetical protein
MTYTTTPATMHSGHDIRDERGSMVAIVHNPKADPAEGARIAALMAAAPEMLAALQALTITARTFRNVPKENQDWTPYDDAALDNAFAIITRATGAAQ